MMQILQSLLLRLKCNGEPDSLLVGVPVGFAVGLGVGFGALVGLVIRNFCGKCVLTNQSFSIIATGLVIILFVDAVHLSTRCW